MNNKFTLSFDKKTTKLIFELFWGVTIYRAAIEIVYRTQISTLYAYTGFECDFSFNSFILSLVLMYSLLPAVMKCVNNISFSSTVLLLIYYLNFVPGTVFMSYTRIAYTIPWYIYFCLLYFFCTSFSFRFSINTNHIYMNKQFVYSMAILFSVVILFIWIYYAHGRIQIGLDDLYSVRLEARSFGMPMVFRYIFASMKIVLPVFVVWALNNRNYWIALLFSFVQLIAFFTDGSKSTLFSLLVAIIGFFVLKNNEIRIKRIPWLLTGISFFGILEYQMLRSYQIAGIIIRRVMFVPQSLNVKYYDFFSSHNPDYFKSSVLKFLGFSSEYGSIARMIGFYYSGSKSLAANNGLFSDAFANLGYLGILILPLLIAMLLRILDELSKGLNISIIIGSTIPFTVALISSSIFTMFLSHGVIALMLMFYFFPRNNENINQNNSG